MWPYLVGGLLILFVVLGVIWSRVRSAADEKSPLSVYLELGRDYRYLVGHPLGAPTDWVTVNEVSDDLITLTLSNGERVRVGDVTSYIVTYPSGDEVSRVDPMSLPEPHSVGGLARQDVPDSTSLSLDDIRHPQDFIEVSHGKSPTHPRERNYYSTTLRNKSDVAVRVTKFGAFGRAGDRFVLTTVTEGFYSEQQFREWFGVGADGWIPPGQSVTDPSNYGGRTGYWVYYCESQNGQRFLASAPLPGR